MATSALLSKTEVAARLRRHPRTIAIYAAKGELRGIWVGNALRFEEVMCFAALPALANFAGGGLAEVFRVSGRALHLTAGIVVAVVRLELMPTALDTSLP